MKIKEKQELLTKGSSFETDDDDEEKNFEEHKKPLIESTDSPENIPPLSIAKIRIYKPRKKRIILRKHLLYLSLLCLFFYLIFVFKSKFYLFFKYNSNHSINNQYKCDIIGSEPIWNKTLPVLTDKSGIRLVDVNNDSIYDIVLTFKTGINDQSICQAYFNISDAENNGCGGGIMAVDGPTGNQIWSQYTPYELSGLNCNVDINGDQVKDCIVGGQMDFLYAFDGATGNVIWSINGNFDEAVTKLFTPLYIPYDLDYDNISEIIVMRGGGGQIFKTPAELLIISAKKGTILSRSLLPESGQSFSPPQLLTRSDGTLLILFSSSSKTSSGSLYLISFDDLLKNKMENSRLIYKNCCQRITMPPILVDLNNDDIADIILTVNNSLIVFDGTTYKILWQRLFSTASEIYSPPTVGYFNNDSILDIALIFKNGSGFPFHYKGELNIIDGHSGETLQSQIMNIATRSHLITISTYSKNDAFAFWYSSCNNISGTVDKIFKDNISGTVDQRFTDNISGTDQTSTDQTHNNKYCKLQSSMFTQLRIMTPNMSEIIYDTQKDTNQVVENFTTFSEKQDSIVKDNFNNFDNYFQNTQANLQNAQQDDLQNNQNIYNQLSSAISYDNRNKNSFPQLRFRRNIDYEKIFDGGLKIGLFGTLAPPLMKNSKTIDLIFVTSSKNINPLTTHMFNCLSTYVKAKTKRDSSYVKRKRDSSYVKRKRDSSYVKTETKRDSSYVKTQSDGVSFQNQEQDFSFKYNENNYDKQVYNFCLEEIQRTQPDLFQSNDILTEMGSVTIHRVNIKCTSTNGHVVEIKDYQDQIWPNYMGKKANCIANINNYFD